MSKTYRFTTTETTARDIARAFFTFQLRRPNVLLTYALVVGFAFVMSIALKSRVYGVVYLILMFGLLPVLTIRRLASRFGALYPVGTELSTSFSDRELHLVTPLATSDMAYELFRMVRVQGSFVILRQKTGTVYFVLPRELFPDEQLAVMRARLARS